MEIRQNYMVFLLCRWRLNSELILKSLLNKVNLKNTTVKNHYCKISTVRKHY